MKKMFWVLAIIFASPAWSLTFKSDGSIVQKDGTTVTKSVEDFELAYCDGAFPPDSKSDRSTLTSELDLRDVLSKAKETRLPKRPNWVYDGVGNISGYSNAEIKVVSDFNNDGRDDLLIDFYENNEPPLILFSKGDGTFEQGQVPDTAGRRHMRDGVAADLNQDGWLDFYGFTVGESANTYRLEAGVSLAVDFGEGEKDLLLINNRDGSFTDVDAPEIVDNAYNHGGTAGDFDNDGHIDILSLPEREGVRKVVSFNDGSGNLTLNTSQLSPVFSEYLTSDATSADYNGDGIEDIAVGVRSFPGVSDKKTGSVWIVYGDSDRDFSNNKIARLGRIWVSPDQVKDILDTANQYGLGVKADPTKKSPIAVGGLGSIDTLDINDDGRPDILASYFINVGISGWRTSGFQALINQGGCFEDQTDIFFPNQVTNRNYAPDIPKGFAHTFFHEDISGDGKKDFVVSMHNRPLASKELFGQPSSIVFINEGERGYLPVIADKFFGGLFSKQHVLGDFDGDGNHDLAYIANMSQLLKVHLYGTAQSQSAADTLQEQKFALARQRVEDKRVALEAEGNALIEVLKERGVIFDAGGWVVTDKTRYTPGEWELTETAQPDKPGKSTKYRFRIRGAGDVTNGELIRGRTTVFVSPKGHKKIGYNLNRLFSNSPALIDSWQKTTGICGPFEEGEEDWIEIPILTDRQRPQEWLSCVIRESDEDGMLPVIRTLVFLGDHLGQTLN